LFLINISNRSKIKKLKSKYNKFMSGVSDKNMEQLLEINLDKINEIIKRNKGD
jgi:hypothetical protein